MEYLKNKKQIFYRVINLSKGKGGFIIQGTTEVPRLWTNRTLRMCIYVVAYD